MIAAKGRYVDLPTPTGVQRWRLAFKKMRDYGVTDWASRTIWLRSNMSKAELVGTVVHEAAHVASGVGSEATIESLIERVEQGAVAMLLKLDLIVNEDD